MQHVLRIECMYSPKKRLNEIRKIRQNINRIGKTNGRRYQEALICGYCKTKMKEINERGRSNVDMGHIHES